MCSRTSAIFGRRDHQPGHRSLVCCPTVIVTVHYTDQISPSVLPIRLGVNEGVVHQFKFTPSDTGGVCLCMCVCREICADTCLSRIGGSRLLSYCSCSGWPVRSPLVSLTSTNTTSCTGSNCNTLPPLNQKA